MQIECDGMRLQIFHSIPNLKQNVTITLLSIGPLLEDNYYL